MVLKSNSSIHERLLESIKRRIREERGPEDKEVEAYYRPYSDELERVRAGSAERETFLRRAAGSPVTLVGDFHTLDQAQKCYLSLVRDLDKAGVRPVLLLEMVLAAHDAALAGYLHGQLDSSEFLERIGYYKHWGFNFHNYEPILTYAKESGLAVHGLNRTGSLPLRDGFMADRIARIIHRYPGPPVLVLVGDLHLASEHLPAALRRAGIEPLTLFQNSESVYRRKLKRGQSPTGWWSLGKNRFLNNNTPPAIKMQSYLLWLEHGGEALCSLYGYCRYDIEPDEEPDLTDTVEAYLKALKDLFALENPIPDDFEVFTLNSLELTKDPFFRNGRGGKLKALLQKGFPMYVKEKSALFVPLLDVNHTVEEAAHCLMGEAFPLGNSLQSYEKRLHYFASGYVGSKLINPNRHTPSLKEMRRRLRLDPDKMSERDSNKLKPERSAFEGVLDYFKATRNGRKAKRGEMDSVLATDRASSFTVSRRAGYIIGEALFEAYNTGKIAGAQLREYVFEQDSPFFLREVWGGFT